MGAGARPSRYSRAAETDVAGPGLNRVGHECLVEIEDFIGQLPELAESPLRNRALVARRIKAAERLAITSAAPTPGANTAARTWPPDMPARQAGPNGFVPKVAAQVFGMEFTEA